MRTFYWMTPEGEFHCEVSDSWLVINQKIPNYSWVCDPEVVGGTEYERCGKRLKSFTSLWRGGKYSDFPPEFKTYLLLMGVTV